MLLLTSAAFISLSSADALSTHFVPCHALAVPTSCVQAAAVTRAVLLFPDLSSRSFAVTVCQLNFLAECSNAERQHLICSCILSSVLTLFYCSSRLPTGA